MSRRAHGSSDQRRQAEAYEQAGAQRPSSHAEGVKFWRDLGHGKDDGCAHDAPPSVHTDPWVEAHATPPEQRPKPT